MRGRWERRELLWSSQNLRENSPSPRFWFVTLSSTRIVSPPMFLKSSRRSSISVFGVNLKNNTLSTDIQMRLLYRSVQKRVKSNVINRTTTKMKSMSLSFVKSILKSGWVAFRWRQSLFSEENEIIRVSIIYTKRPFKTFLKKFSISTFTLYSFKIRDFIKFN